MHYIVEKCLKSVASIILSAGIFITSFCKPTIASAAISQKNISSMISNHQLYMQIHDNFFISPACAPKSVLDIYDNGYRNGSNCNLYQLNYTAAQQFKLLRVGKDWNGSYFVLQKASSRNMVLDVSGGIVRNGQNIQLYQYNGTKAQQWYIKEAGNGYYYFVSRLNTNYVMDVSGASSKNFTNIHLYQKNGTNAQKFSFNICSHSHKHRINKNIYTITGDLIWFNGLECRDCKQVLQYGTWQFPM